MLLSKQEFWQSQLTHFSRSSYSTHPPETQDSLSHPASSTNTAEVCPPRTKFSPTATADKVDLAQIKPNHWRHPNQSRAEPNSIRGYLSVLQRVNLWIERRADNFIIPGVGWRSRPWIDVKSCQALGVCDSVVLPGIKGHAINRAL